MTDTALAGASTDEAAAGRTKRPPRPAAKPHGQWKVDGTTPLNANENWKQEDNGLNVRERIESVYSKRGFDSIDGTDLHGRFRWWGLYTQRKPGIDGGKTATLEPHELEDKYFMLRVRIDGGALTTEQLRVIGQISVDFARDSADLTDRQNIQLHWIRVEDMPEIWRRLEGVGLSTTEACGDVPRVILGSPVAGIAKDEIIDPTPLIQELAERFIGDPELANLPRKFKTAITGHPSQDVVHEINDVALVGVDHPELGIGYDLWVGGALSTNPMLAKRLGVFVRPDEAADVWLGVTSIFRDYGYRRMRTKARLKFLLADWGAEKFRQVLEDEYLGYKLADGPAAPKPSTPGDHIGVHEQKDGKFFIGATPLAGRLSGTSSSSSPTPSRPAARSACAPPRTRSSWSSTCPRTRWTRSWPSSTRWACPPARPCSGAAPSPAPASSSASSPSWKPRSRRRRRSPSWSAAWPTSPRPGSCRRRCPCTSTAAPTPAPGSRPRTSASRA